MLATLLFAGTHVLADSLYPEHPASAGLVNDFAHVLSQSQEAGLEAELRGFEQNNKVELAVVTMTSLKGRDIEGYANGLFRYWGIGKKGADNGVLLLISTGDRKVRIEVGRRLEDILTDAKTSEIIHSTIAPTYKQGDRADAIINGAHLVMQTLTPALVTENKEILSKEVHQKTTSFLWILIPGFGLLLFGIMATLIHDRKKAKSNPASFDSMDSEKKAPPSSPSTRNTYTRRSARSDDSGFLSGAVVGAVAASVIRSEDDDSSRYSSSFGDTFGGSSDSGGGGFDFGGGDSGGGGSSSDL
jgi:uncharacterized protein